MTSRPTRRTLLWTAGAGALAVIGFEASAYPTKPITIVGPTGPGGSADILCRLIADKLAGTLGPVIVENRPGAGGTVAATQVSRAPPDGHTIFLGDLGTNAVAAGVYSKLPYDTLTSFSPITHAINLPLALVCTPSLQVTNIQELVAYAKKNPGVLNFGMLGGGNISLLGMELLKKEAGISAQAIPYKSSQAIITDVISGRVHLALNSVVSLKPFIASDRVRLIASLGSKRAAFYPNVATIAESGWPRVQAESWFGFFAPPATPRDIVDRLNREINAVIRQAEVRQFLENAGFEVVGSSPAEFASLITSETARWKKVLLDANIKPE